MGKEPNKIIQKLKSPSGALVAVSCAVTVAVCTGAILVAVLGGGLVWEWVSYLLYALAAITLGYSVYTIVIFAPKAKARITEFFKRRSFTARILEQYGFRTVVFAVVSLSLSFAYAVFNSVVAIVSSSVWYGALAGYYVLLTGLRGSVLLHRRKRSKKQADRDEMQADRAEFRIYANCGILLTVLPAALSVAIAQMVSVGAAFVRWGWTVYAFAAYAFYKIIMAIYNAVKAKKSDDMTVRSLRNIGLADAMVSILALQTSLLYAFSDGDYGWSIAATGAAVCALTAAIGISMIVGAGRRIKLLKSGGVSGDEGRQ